jgi:hypothetical protein
MSKKIVLILAVLVGPILLILVKRSQEIDLKEAKTSLSAYVMKAEPTQKMVVYEVTSVEKIKRVEALSLLWRLISSANVDTEMLVPVKYSYYIDFNEGFEIEKTGIGYKVTVPALQSNQPAVDVSGISFQVKEAPYFYDTKKIESKILQQLTEYLNTRSEQVKINYYGEARKSVEKVVYSWVMTNEEYESLSDNDIQIVFKNETASDLK